MEPCVSSTECVVCYEIYDDDKNSPRVLTQCGHTVCEKCLKGLFETPDFKCPLCQMTYFSHNGELSFFPKNFCLMSYMAEVGIDKHDFCGSHKEKFIFYDQTHDRYLCPECFYANKLSREDIMTIGTLKKNLLVKTTVFTEKYLAVFNHLKGNTREYFNSLLRSNFQTYNRKLNYYFENNKLSRNLYDSLYNEFLKVFSMFYFLFKQYYQSYDFYRGKFKEFEKLVFFKENANTKRITGSIIKSTTETLLLLESVDAVTIFERSKEISSYFAVKDILLKKLDDNFIDWALDIIVPKNMNESGKISQSKLKLDFSLFYNLVYDPRTPIEVGLSVLPADSRKLCIQLTFWPESRLPAVEFVYDPSEPVNLLKDKKWCAVF